MKRPLTFFSAALGLLVLFPVLLLIAAAVKCDSRGPVFYTPRRVGLNGKIFRIIKFRTMVVDADKMGPGVTCAQDQRITRVGAFLRRYKADEFPQLLNIIKGDMAIVGPRPEDPRYTGMYDPDQRAIFGVRPGLTSPASLRFREESTLLDGANWEDKYINVIMPAKLQIDLEYFRGNSFMSDLELILQTIRQVFIAPISGLKVQVLVVILIWSGGN